MFTFLYEVSLDTLLTHIATIQRIIEAVTDQVNGGFQEKGESLRQNLFGSRRRFRSWFLACLAIQVSTEELLTPTGREHPRALCEGRLVPYMLPMTTGQFGNPVAIFILVVSDNGLLHVVETR